MSAGNYIGYFAHMIDTGKMTEEEANIRFREMFEADMRADELDIEIFEKCGVAYIPRGSLITKEQADVLYEFAKEPIKDFITVK